MPSPDLLLAFLLATAVFAYMPGPSTLYATAQTLAGGRRAGWSAALGIHLGGYVHVLAAATGLAVLFEAVPVLYIALKLLGAGYLVWLGIKMILRRDIAEGAGATAPRKSARRAFWDSIAVEALNPKTALFYIAFLPQFTDPEAALAIGIQLLVLGTVVNLMFSSADVLCVLLADRLATWVRHSRRARRNLERSGGGVLVALGVNLAFERA